MTKETEWKLAPWMIVLGLWAGEPLLAQTAPSAQGAATPGSGSLVRQ